MFVKNIIPYLLSEEKNKFDIWYIDETANNVNLGPRPNKGWAPLGKTPVVNIPIK